MFMRKDGWMDEEGTRGWIEKVWSKLSRFLEAGRPKKKEKIVSC